MSNYPKLVAEYGVPQVVEVDLFLMYPDIAVCFTGKVRTMHNMPFFTFMVSDVTTTKEVQGSEMPIYIELGSKTFGMQIINLSKRPKQPNYQVEINILQIME